MKTPSVLFGALVCSLIGGAVAGFLYVQFGPFRALKTLDLAQPDCEFVWSFNADTVQDLPNFYKALAVKSEGGLRVFVAICR